MNYNEIEDKRNQLNLELRSLLAIIDLIDGKNVIYEDYISNSLDEIGFLNQQMKLVIDAKNRLLNVFKD